MEIVLLAMLVELRITSLNAIRLMSQLMAQHVLLDGMLLAWVAKRFALILHPVLVALPADRAALVELAARLEEAVTMEAIPAAILVVARAMHLPLEGSQGRVINRVTNAITPACFPFCVILRLHRLTRTNPACLAILVVT